MNAPELSDTSEGTVVLRRACIDDVPGILELLADDPLGSVREGADGGDRFRAYREALGAIDADPAHLLLVADSDGALVATMQLSFLPGLARRGALRAQIEAVRVHADRRGEVPRKPHPVLPQQRPAQGHR